MASKKKAKTATLQVRVNELQKTAEKTLRKGVERTFELLPPAPRKAVKGWVAGLEKARLNLRKRTDKALREARKRVDRVTSDVQKRVEKAVSPVARNFDFASRKDIDSLRKRLDHIERRLTERTASASHHEHSALA
jgi:hypothetical protein